jgi:hypothetical protein
LSRSCSISFQIGTVLSDAYGVSGSNRKPGVEKNSPGTPAAVTLSARMFGGCVRAPL